MSSVFVVDQQRKPLNPVHPGRARHLLTAGHAAVLRRYPFTIILKDPKPETQPQPLRVKLDPGSKTTGSGGRTKWNRRKQGLPKAHWLDAACVGASTPDSLSVQGSTPLVITAMGRHSRQMCRTNAYGFPDKAPKTTSVVGGLRTGDIVRAAVPATSKKVGVYVGRIAIRATGSCNIKTARGTIQGIHYRYCQPLHRADGYTYTKGAASPSLT